MKLAKVCEKKRVYENFLLYLDILKLQFN